MERKVAIREVLHKGQNEDFPGGAADSNSPANAGDTGSIPGQEDSSCCGATT